MARDIPRMDWNSPQAMAGVQPYVAVTCGSKTVKTKRKASRDPQWRQEVGFQLMLPPEARGAPPVRFQLYDHNFTSSDNPIAAFRVPFRVRSRGTPSWWHPSRQPTPHPRTTADVFRPCATAALSPLFSSSLRPLLPPQEILDNKRFYNTPRWYPLYGAPREPEEEFRIRSGSKLARRMNCAFVEGNTYRGMLYMSVSADLSKNLPPVRRRTIAMTDPKAPANYVLLTEARERSLMEGVLFCGCCGAQPCASQLSWLSRLTASVSARVRRPCPQILYLDMTLPEDRGLGSETMVEARRDGPSAPPLLTNPSRPLINATETTPPRPPSSPYPDVLHADEHQDGRVV